MSFQTDLYDDILESIYVLTARRDLDGETELALRTATISAHHSGHYVRDFNQQLVQIPNASYATALNINTLFPRFRGVNYVMPVDVNYNVLTADEYKIEVVEIGDDRNPDGTKKSNIAYVAGSSLNILTSANSYGYLVGWYSSPPVRREQYDSWIAQLYSPAIIYWAASIVLNTNGNEEKAAKYLKQVMDIHLPYLTNNYLLGAAR